MEDVKAGLGTKINPLTEPGVDLPDTGWTNDPAPGLYYIRYVNEDGTKTQPAFCVVTPTGPVGEYACWAWTPNIGEGTLNHPSWQNYFVSDQEKSIEYFPYSSEIVVRDDEGGLKYRKVVFEIFPKVL